MHKKNYFVTMSLEADSFPSTGRSQLEGAFISSEFLGGDNMSDMEEFPPQEKLNPEENNENSTFPSFEAEESMNQEVQEPVQEVQEIQEVQEEVEASTQTVQEDLPETSLEQIQEEIAHLGATIHDQSYLIGEVPQIHQVDPECNLAINSKKLEDFETLYADVENITCEEISQIQKFQKSIDSWESKIEHNKSLIEKNKAVIKQNSTEIIYDKKNRDYWQSRSEHVLLDYGTASAANRSETWAWFIKKHGLKNPDSSQISENHSCVEELCNGGASNLSSEYKVAGVKYDQAKRDKETENFRLTSENSKYKTTIEKLQKYIQATYQDRIEPLQDGVLLMKELGAKVRSFESQGSIYGDMREWAEEFLNEYLIENPNTPQYIITDFRRITSIPLPSENS